jgi:hypothetical protein
MTYEKGLFAQADPGIVSGSTIERKKMSTKTIYKRIALVAVAALGAGLLTVTPANAATNDIIWCNIADGLADAATKSATAQAGNDACNGVAGPANSVELEFDAASANSRLTITGPGTFGAAGDAADLAVATNGLSATVLAAGDQATTVAVNTPTVGTVTVSYFELVAAGSTIYQTEATEIVTITVNATASAGVPSLTFSKTLMAGTLAAADTETEISAGTADTVIAASGLVPAVAAAYIGVYIADALDADVITGTVSASITGPGTVGVASCDDDADIHSSSAKADSDAIESGAGACDGTYEEGVAMVTVYSDGSAGVSTITIKHGTTTIATKTVTFYGNVATVTATQRLRVADASGTNVLGNDGAALTSAVNVVLKDSLGNPAVAAVTATPADTAVISAGTCSASTTPGTYWCEIDPAASTSGKSTTVVFSAVGAAAAVIKSAPITFTLGGTTPSTVSMAFDKTSYAPGGAMVLTITAKDAAGNPVADGTKDNLTAAAGIVFNYATGIASTEEQIDDLVFVGGSTTMSTFAPLTGGAVSVSATLGSGVATAAVGTTVTATSTVGANAELSAITTLVNSLIAKINALNKLVIKIQKKVRA